MDELKEYKIFLFLFRFTKNFDKHFQIRKGILLQQIPNGTSQIILEINYIGDKLCLEINYDGDEYNLLPISRNVLSSSL